GNRSFTGFSSENVTWAKTAYVSTRNQTVVSGSLSRLGENGLISIRLNAPSRKLDIWVSSNETGVYLTAPSTSTSTLDTIVGTLGSVQFYVVLIVFSTVII